MEVKEVTVGSITHYGDHSMFAARVSVTIDDGELRQNIGLDLRLAGAKQLSLEDAERLARQKASDLLSLASRSL